MKKKKTVPLKKVHKNSRITLPRQTFDLLKGVFDDAVGEALEKLIDWVRDDELTDVEEGIKRYRTLWLALADTQEFIRRPRAGNSLQDHLLERFLEDPNPVHRKAELTSLHHIGPALTNLYAQELESFLTLVRTNWEMLFHRKIGSSGAHRLPSISGLRALEVPGHLPPYLAARLKLKEHLLHVVDPIRGIQLLPGICAHFLENGFGIFGRYRAFRWVNGFLEGIAETDPVLLEDLVGCEDSKELLVENAGFFAAGKPANHVLIYGDRGTGKSSMIKALFNAFREKGVRLVEVSPRDLLDYPAIIGQLSVRREKFILFVDDLSFEENETDYKGLKALLEGTVEAAPSNAMLMATSNRRHLVREFFVDREGGEEVHGQDTVQEKLSLSDRFGLVVSFLTPDQAGYLAIVDHLARKVRLTGSKSTMHEKALQWAVRHNGRSGRTAKQFINDFANRV